VRSRVWSRSGVAALTIVAVAALVGAARLAGAATQSPAAAKANPINMAIVLGGPAPYFDGMYKKWNVLAKQNGVHFLNVIADWTPQKQADQIDALLTQKPDVIVLYPVDTKAIIPVLVRIKAAGIPVVMFGSYPDKKAQPLIAGWVGPNDILQGQLAARSLVKALKTKTGEVAMIRGTPGSAANVQRAQGFKDVLKQIAPGLKIVADQNSAWGDKKKTYDIATAILQRNPNVLGIFSQDDTAGAGAAQAAKDLGKKVVVVGVGGSCEGLKLIKTGVIAATTEQDAWVIAQMSFDAALEVVHGKKIPAITLMPAPVITRANVGKFVCHW
jgi:ribose transport system substrate-binding protein